MEDKEKLAIAQDWVRKLANGINPINGSIIKEDDVVNNVHISRCLLYVADILGKRAERKFRSNQLRNISFVASAVQKEKYNYVDGISISAFIREIERIIPENMQSLNYKSILKWLIQKGYIVENEVDETGHAFKIPTEKGKRIGIYTEKRERTGGYYIVTLYNRNAQRYLLDNLEEISCIR